MRKTEIMGAVPAVGAALLPNLSCPACWPACASLLSAAGLTFLAESKYLLWLNLVALLNGLVVLLRRARTRGYRPLVLGTIASIAILTGKFEFPSNAITWLGGAALVTAFIWSGAVIQSAPKCPQCETNFGGVSKWQQGK